jgi:tetratricopeptide (TPR) repeat protein
MIHKIFLCIILCFCMASANSQTSAEWQIDLKHLQQTVHTKYNNLFYNISSNEWDKNVDDFYKQIPSLKKEVVLVGFIQLLTSFHIGHTLVDISEFNQDSKSLQLNRLPYGLYSFNDGVYILTAAGNYHKAVGGKVIRIGNLKISDALEAIRPLVSYENEQGFKNKSMYYLAIPEFLKTQGITSNASQVPITWVKGGIEETTVFNVGTNANEYYSTGLELQPGWLVAQKKGTTPLWKKEPNSYRYMEYLPNSKTLYIRHSITGDDGDKTIEAFFNTMVNFVDQNDVEKLVLDVRTNEGGDNYLNKAIITSIIKLRKINQTGKFFCIIGRKTFSAAQNLVNELEKNTEVIFVGEPTSENVNFYADIRTETLPNSKLKAQLSWLWWQNMDARDKRKCTSPDLAVDMSFNDYYNHVDPAMEVIEHYQSKQAPIDKQLTLMLWYGKYEEVVKLASDYLKDPLHRYYKGVLEEKLLGFGSDFINNYRIADANKIMGIGIHLFPESANLHYHYAESLMLLGKKEEAIRSFKTAISKDKTGVTTGKSKNMLSRLYSNTN